MKPINQETIDFAMQWFEDNHIPSYQNDDHIYVVFTSYNGEDDVDILISNSELEYRAELQKNKDKPTL